MKRLLMVLTLALLAAGVGGTPALAAFNVGASYTDTEVDDPSGFEADDSNYKVFAGWRFFERQWLGVEVQYMDFGDFSAGGTNAEVSGYGAFVLASIGVWRMDFFGKAGFASWDAELSNLPDEDGSDPAYGIGIAFRVFEKFYVRAEYERFELDDADADVASLGADFRF
jgi:hypothetical protein